jgi:lysyl-tRNA synthetase class 2
VDDLNRVMSDRLRKLEGLVEAGTDPFANGFSPTATAAQVLDSAESASLPDMGAIEPGCTSYAVAGRVMFKNVMGKAMFLRIRDRSVGIDSEGHQTLQLYARRDVIGEDAYRGLKALDVGDIIGVDGPLFQTRTGEATIYIQSGGLLTKSLRPLPEKFHGLSDVETRYRQRYVDLVMNAEVRQVFLTRSRIVRFVRHFLEEHDYIEVETPMMHVIPGGATARPFETHHNALDMPLFMRIAPELHLKRLVVGGLERVYELNRCFRNEGLSPKHNPEFTTVEFYQAFATYEDLMDLTEDMIRGLAAALATEGDLCRPMGDHVIDYGKPFARYTMVESLSAVAEIDPAVAGNRDRLLERLRGADHDALSDDLAYGHALVLAFETWVEPRLIQPTYITQHPVETSPLARRNAEDPAFTDRFELFIAGMEIANAFSELNDPIDQRARFEEQAAAREAGDKEAMFMDMDFVRALEVGMPPTAGEGIGIDRLVMLMTNQRTIREVILFPHMRPE